MRVAPWEEVEGRVVIERPRPASRGPGSWLDWLAYFTATRRIRLDAAGSAAWRLLDGTRTVSRVAGELRRELGEEYEPVEERLGLLVRALRKEGFLAYPGWDRPDPT